MALSKSVEKAQDIISCQLCEVGQNLEKKCLECELLMCKKCYEKIHPKFKNAKDHRVIDIKDVGRYGLQSTEPDFSNIKCHQHETQACCLHCSSCGLLVCPICIAQGHKGHDFLEIKESYLKKLDQLKVKLKNIEFKKSKIEKQKRNIAQEAGNEFEKCEEVLQAVQNQRKMWEMSGLKYFEDNLAEVKKKRDEINKLLSTEQSVLDESKNQLLQNEKKSTEMLVSRNASVFFQNIGKLLENFDEDVLVFPPPKYNPVLTFTPGNISQEMFGTLVESTEVQSMKILMKRKFTTDLNRCHHLATSENGIVCMCDSYANVMIVYKQNGDTITPQTTLHLAVADIQSCFNSSLLIANATSTLKTIESKDSTPKKSKYQASPFLIFAAHVTSDNKIIIGANSTVDLYDVDCRHVVMRFDSQGKLEMTWEYDQDVKKIFTFPRYLSSSDNGNIFAVDWLSAKKNGRVVVLKGDGGILNTYTGHPEINKDGTLFKPLNIKQTPTNNILVCDYNTNTLHLLNSSGDFMTFFDTKTIDITDICSMTFSTSGTLFIGTAPENDKKSTPDNNKAMLYELEFSEILSERVLFSSRM